MNVHHSATIEPDGRAAGVLLHPTSLPGRFGIGDLGDEAIQFLDWVKSAGLRIWQVLPLNPPGYGNSPYGCLSSYAGNPMLISPERLVSDGLLPAALLTDLPSFPNHSAVDFEGVTAVKTRLLRQSFTAFEAAGSSEHRTELAAFERDNLWLDDWALYVTLKDENGGATWSEWPAALANRQEAAIALSLREFAIDLRFHKYVQWLFFSQWAAVRSAAEQRGIRILGDVPIYVAWDSADVWSNREIFQLDASGQPTVVAGVPPDYFSTTGQRWGNPLYRWDVLDATDYRWWVSRFRAALRFADVVRIDHFRGFVAYWEIPASEPTAIHGRWMPGPGKALFDAIQEEMGELPLVAEDLGFITPEVHALRKAIGVPGMKILQFAFSQTGSPHLPHCYEPLTVVYTGTHDNDTARGWFEHAPDEERAFASSYLGIARAEDAPAALIRAAYTSVARTAIVPAQDILGLGSEARMNRPGACDDNWSWRCAPGALSERHAEELRKLAEISGRIVV